jgi:hypothetical protein
MSSNVISLSVARRVRQSRDRKAARAALVALLDDVSTRVAPTGHVKAVVDGLTVETCRVEVAGGHGAAFNVKANEGVVFPASSSPAALSAGFAGCAASGSA